MSIEATEHHEIVLEVESELRGLRKALDIITTYRWGSNGSIVLVREIERVQQVLNEITEDDDDE